MVYRPGQFTRLLAIAKNFRGARDPRKRALDAGPMGCRFVQAAVDELLQFLELAREPLFSATRSRLWEMCVNRSRSLRPAATNGGRPSSVIALRTAAQ